MPAWLEGKIENARKKHISVIVEEKSEIEMKESLFEEMEQSSM